jgi:Flp pilus assembly pilin Flp
VLGPDFDGLQQPQTESFLSQPTSLARSARIKNTVDGGINPMNQILRTLWTDDRGALIATEYLFFVTIVIIGTIAGLANVRDAINTELTETGNALLALSQGFAVSGTSGSTGSTNGSMAIDSGNGTLPLTAVPPANPSVIDVSLPGS